MKQLKVFLKDTIFDPTLPPGVPRKVHVRKREDGTHLYKVWLFLDGKDLPYVRGVTYVLHHTFQNPTRNVIRSSSNPNCQLVIWTWGLFQVRAQVQDKEGFLHEMEHQLNYDKELPTDLKMYVYE